MSGITTHVLDAVLGKPASGIAIQLDILTPNGWSDLAHGSTDQDGRCRDLCLECQSGTYRLTFASAEYFHRNNRSSIYQEVAISFLVDGASQYHIPLLLSDNSYTTYRGS
jgi:5-hydroxyisourate hydrolase